MYQLRDKRAVDNVWRISTIQPADRYQRVGYPTQKPEALLRRIILGFPIQTNDVVADFFCGGGTTPVVAQRTRDGDGLDAIAQESRVSITLDRLNAVPQQQYQGCPDISRARSRHLGPEHWGIYQIPALTQLSQDDIRPLHHLSLQRQGRHRRNLHPWFQVRHSSITLVPQFPGLPGQKGRRNRVCEGDND